MRSGGLTTIAATERQGAALLTGGVFAKDKPAPESANSLSYTDAVIAAATVTLPIGYCSWQKHGGNAGQADYVSDLGMDYADYLDRSDNLESTPWQRISITRVETDAFATPAEPTVWFDMGHVFDPGTDALGRAVATVDGVPNRYAVRPYGAVNTPSARRNTASHRQLRGHWSLRVKKRSGSRAPCGSPKGAIERKANELHAVHPRLPQRHQRIGWKLLGPRGTSLRQWTD